MRTGARPGGGRGATLVEALVAASLTVLVLALALALVVEAGRAAPGGARGKGRAWPPTDLVLDRIDEDVREATTVTVRASAAAAIELPGGDRVVYGFSEGTLTRTLRPAAAASDDAARAVTLAEGLLVGRFDVEDGCLVTTLRRDGEPVRLRSSLPRRAAVVPATRADAGPPSDDEDEAEP
jgi:hypothetical protein